MRSRRKRRSQPATCSGLQSSRSSSWICAQSALENCRLLRPVAAVARRLIAPHFAADRAAVAPEPPGDRGGGEALLPQEPHGVPFLAGDLVIRHTWAPSLGRD